MHFKQVNALLNIYAFRFSCFVFLLASVLTARAQDFPDALSLLEYLQGVQREKVPELISSDILIDDFINEALNKKALEYFSATGGHYIIYQEGLGFNGQIFSSDNQKVILRNEVVYETSKIDIEHFLLFGIFKGSPSQSVETLKKLGIDTQLVYDAIRLGRTMWIIGADRRDPETPQLWIDKKYLAVRKIHYLNLPQNEVQQMEFDDHVDIKGFYLPKSVEIKKEPVLKLRKKRYDIRQLDALPGGIYRQFID